MKSNLVTYLLLLASCIVTTSCSHIKPDNNTNLIAIVSAIEGKYILSSASFSEEVDLCGDGEGSTNILSQMEKTGWHGVFDVDGKNAMCQNTIFPTLSFNEETQANFYVPISVGPNVGPLSNNMRSSVGLAEYQFHYYINDLGELVLDYPVEEIFNNRGIALRNIVVKIVPKEKTVVIEANTHFYDLSKDGWFGGHMIMVYNRIDSNSSE